MSFKEGDGLRIYYSCNSYPNNYIECFCNRWDEDNWSVIIETFMRSGARNELFTYVTPGAVKELYSILGDPYFIDTTYASANTLIFEPQHGFGISSLREKRMIGVKNISDSFINPNYFNIKIEGYRINE